MIVPAITSDMEPLGWGLAAVGILLVTLSLLMGIRKRRRRANNQVGAQENLERYKARSQVRDDLERVMVEVEEMARRVSAQLDAKTIALEKLLREADQRIARLKALQDEANQRQSKDATSSASTASGAASASSASVPTTTPATKANSADAGAEQGAQGQQPQDALSRRVYELADEGLAPPEIARKLHEHIGKIELILALRSTA